MRGFLSAILSFAILVMASSCERPTSYEQFVKVSEKGEDGLYRYSLDMSDSTATYDVAFYSRIDCSTLKLTRMGDFPMVVTWISPSGTSYQEKVYFSVRGYLSGSDFYSHQYRMPYRSALAPVEWGQWEMTVRIDAEDLIPGFRGLGVTLSTDKDDDGAQET